jgi:hypothetical protein
MRGGLAMLARLTLTSRRPDGTIVRIDWLFVAILPGWLKRLLGL